ncbi:MAG TPA: SCO family protein [Pyrinomonadaceae bacterium]|jgi:protein SCO1/2|nr:SCO family protein [Pyrinomonadaceae bacterium]
MFYRFSTRLLYVFAVIGLLLSFAAAQRVEHYNSPLYSPKVYDPTVGPSAGLPDALKEVGIEQKLGNTLPLDATFQDEKGNSVKLGDYFKSGRPVILALVYYECPMLCNQVLNGLVGSLKGINLDAGKDFDVLAVSFDANEYGKTELAANKKASYLENYQRPGTENGWHFLTGSQQSIDQITGAAGFHYKWDEKTNQFAHASAIIIVNPDGRISHYFYGIDYLPKDVKLGLIEASDNKIGTAADQLLLYCYHYDPATGKYGFAILNAIRLGGILTLLTLGAMVFIFWQRGRKSGNPDKNADKELEKI